MSAFNSDFLYLDLPSYFVDFADTKALGFVENGVLIFPPFLASALLIWNGLVLVSVFSEYIYYYAFLWKVEDSPTLYYGENELVGCFSNYYDASYEFA